MSRYDHALNKKPKSNLISKVAKFLNGDGVRTRTGVENDAGSHNQSSENRNVNGPGDTIRGRSDTTGNVGVLGESLQNVAAMHGINFLAGSTGPGHGINFLAGSTGPGYEEPYQGVTGSGLGQNQGDMEGAPYYPILTNPADPSATFSDLRSARNGRRTASDTPNQSLNSISTITPSRDGTVLEGAAPALLNFTLTGPGGYRIFIPIRNLDINIRDDTIVEIRLSSQVVRSLVDDIVNNGGRERIRIDGSL